MKKYTLLFFVVAFVLSFFVFKINFLDAQNSLPDCSSVSGYKLIKGQSCVAYTDDPVIFNFKARDPDGDNLAWSMDWGDGSSFSKVCPAKEANTYLRISHGWSKAGTYNVKLGVSDCNSGEASASFNVVVKSSYGEDINNISQPTIPNTLSVNDFDLSVQKVGIWPTEVSQGKFITLNAKILNLGKKEYDYVFYNSSYEVKKKIFSILRTSSNGTYDLSSYLNTNISLPSNFEIWDGPACGNNHYVFKVDGGNGLTEVSENNNEISGDVFVDCSKKPDFVIEKVGTWATTVKSGSKPVFNFIEKNIGEVSAGRAGTVRMTVNNQYEAGSWYFGSLGVGSAVGPTLFGYQVFSSPPTDNDWWIPICSKGDKFTLKVCADNACGWGSSEIEESNENNNILIHEVTCE
ncbi:MAG: PKD domain-containing protein [Burkholderiales bacterium]|nr:PKD domain-containing protein [Burkholderiales bacterium]